jgi:methionyl-tRNA formyltransferase
MGSPEFAVPSLHATHAACDIALVMTQPDRPAGRGQKMSACAVKTAALELGLTVETPDKIRNDAVLQRLRELNLDLIVVVAYGKILPKSLLEVPRFGCINVHASLLPRWRGAAPIQRSLAAGDRVTGVCIMQLDEGCDTGPVFAREVLVIDPEESAGDLTGRLARLGGRALQSFLSAFEKRGKPQPQDEALATHAAKLEKSEGYTDWTASAARVNQHVRGMDPWPGAYSELHESTIKLFGARAFDRKSDASFAGSVQATPGEILAIDDKGLLVQCGDGPVWILEMQAPGKKRLAAQVFAVGSGLKIGERFAIDPARSKGLEPRSAAGPDDV